MNQARDDTPGAATRWHLLLLAILLLGVALRVNGLGRHSMWYDEGLSIWSGKVVADPFFGIFAWDSSHELPLNALIMSIWYPLIESIPGVVMGSALSDFLLRLLPTFFGILCILLTFLTARYLLKDPAPALAAAFFVAISPFHIHYAQELRPHMLYVLTNVAFFYFALKALEENRTRHWAAMVFCGVAAMYNYYFSIFFIASFNVFFLVNLKSYRTQLAKWIASQAIVAILVIPALLMALVQAKFHSQATEIWFLYPTPTTLAITFKSFFAGYGRRPAVYWCLFLLCGVLVCLGLLALRKKPKALTCLLTLLGVSMAANMLVWYTQSFPFYTHRGQLPSSIPCFILAGMGLVSLKRRPVIAVVTGLVAVLTAFALTDHYAQRIHPLWHHRLGARYKVDNRSTAQYMARRIEPGDYVTHTSHFTMAPFEHHYLRVPQSIIGFTNEEREGLLASYPDEEGWERTGWMPRRIETVIEDAKRVWYVSSWWEPTEPIPNVYQFRDWFDAHAIRMDRAPFDGITAYLYDLDPGLLSSVQVSQVADYGDDVVLHYAFPDTEGFRDVRKEWENSFARQFPLDTSSRTSAFNVAFEVEVLHGPPPTRDALDTAYPDYSILAVSGDPSKTILAAMPLSLRNDYTCRIRVTNPTDIPRTIEGWIYESSRAIEALAFDRDIESDVWRPAQFQHRKPALAARLDQAITTGTIRADVQLDPGEYAVFIRYLQENNPTNQFRNHLRIAARFADGHEQPLGVINANDPSGTRGWVWRKAGEIASGGTPFVLELTAENIDNLPRAYFDFERVVFVPSDEGQGSAPPETAHFKLTVPPHAEKPLTFAGKRSEMGGKRVDIEFRGTESGQFRNLYFHTPGPAGE